MAAAIGVRGDSDAAPVGSGGDLRWRVSHRGRQVRRGRAANGAGLGAGLQRRGTAGAGERQGAGQHAAAQPGAPAGAAGDRRERPDPGGSRRRALAVDRLGAMGVRGIPHLDQQADAEPRIARPRLAQAVGPAAPSCPGCRGPGGVQKNFAASLDEIAERDAAGQPIEIWFQDEARIGQKNKITRRWARRGTRPSAPHDQRTRSTYIFGAICPAQGTAAGLVLPRCNTAAMALHLAEISRTITPGAHAVLLLDQAGWHLSDKLLIPDNITLFPLPPKSPELNPVANIWQFIRDNWLSNRVFRSYDNQPLARTRAR